METQKSLRQSKGVFHSLRETSISNHIKHFPNNLPVSLGLDSHAYLAGYSQSSPSFSYRSEPIYMSRVHLRSTHPNSRVISCFHRPRRSLPTRQCSRNGPRTGACARGHAGGESGVPWQRGGWWWGCRYHHNGGKWRETHAKSIGGGLAISTASVLQGLLLRQGYFAPAGRGFPPFREKLYYIYYMYQGGKCVTIFLVDVILTAEVEEMLRRNSDIVPSTSIFPVETILKHFEIKGTCNIPSDRGS